jgi:hypothetical protein
VGWRRLTARVDVNLADRKSAGCFLADALEDRIFAFSQQLSARR